MPRGWRTLAFAAALAAAAPAWVAASEADAFEDKIQPVSGMLYAKSGRFEITPTANLSINDPFFSKYFYGVKIGYHLTEYWSVHGSFATGGSNPTGSTTVCTTGCRPANLTELFQLPGRLKWMGGVEVGFSPVYGKLNLVAQQVAHFDVSILAGVDYISFQEAVSGTSAQNIFSAGGRPPTVNSLGGHLGVGTRFFFAGFMALRLELKDYLYPATIGNTGQTQLQRQLMAEIGLSFFFPTSPKSNR
jgi:outer membrane beta-barrel protein